VVAVDPVVASVVVVVGLESGGVAEPLSSLHAPTMSRAISATPGATRRAREGLTPATIPAAAAASTAVGAPRRSRTVTPCGGG
jgi:hypothetical protein